jgi:hypothetical protein
MVPKLADPKAVAIIHAVFVAVEPIARENHLSLKTGKQATSCYARGVKRGTVCRNVVLTLGVLTQF